MQNDTVINISTYASVDGEQGRTIFGFKNWIKYLSPRLWKKNLVKFTESDLKYN